MVTGRETVEQIMERIGTPTLKAFAQVMGVQPNRLYSVAKQPKVGEIYDSHVYNWDALDRFMFIRLKEGVTLEEFVQSALVADEAIKEADGRHRPNNPPKKTNIGGVDGTLRLYPSFEKGSGWYILLYDDENIYDIAVQTATHSVLVPLGGSRPKVISNTMLNKYGIPPLRYDTALAERQCTE